MYEMNHQFCQFLLTCRSPCIPASFWDCLDRHFETQNREQDEKLEDYWFRPQSNLFHRDRKNAPEWNVPLPWRDVVFAPTKTCRNTSKQVEIWQFHRFFSLFKNVDFIFADKFNLFSFFVVYFPMTDRKCKASQKKM